MDEIENLEGINLNDEDYMIRIIDNLELKSYKYRELCELLGQEPIDSKNSHGKNSQLRRWQRFFEFEKKGHSIIIAKIYDAPTPIATWSLHDRKGDCHLEKRVEKSSEAMASKEWHPFSDVEER